MANEDNGTRFGDKSKVKKTIYRNGKLVKDEMASSPRPKAKPAAKAAPAKRKAAPAKRKEIPAKPLITPKVETMTLTTPAKRKETPAKPLTTPKVETMKGIAPSGGRGNGRVEMVRRTAERALDKVGKAAPKAAFKSEQTKRDAKRAKEPVAMKIYDKVYGKDKVKMK